MKLILILATAIVTASIATRAQAQNYPWCAQYSGAMGGAMNCGFSTFQQCLADVSGIGGFCEANDTYQPPAAPRRRGHPKP
jgi:hypothetical protein